MSLVKQTIMAEIQHLLPLSAKYKEEFNNAKTNTKRKYMMKKLHQNNKKVRDLFVALDRLNPKKDVQDTTEG